MKASRRTYAVAIGAATLVLAGSMVGAAAYAANDGTSGKLGQLLEPGTWQRHHGRRLGWWRRHDGPRLESRHFDGYPRGGT